MQLIFHNLEPDERLRVKNEELNEEEGQNAEEDEDGGEGEAEDTSAVRHQLAKINSQVHHEFQFFGSLLPSKEQLSQSMTETVNQVQPQPKTLPFVN